MMFAVCRRAIICAGLALACASGLLVDLGRAGQGPQNILVVANRRSPLSVAIAHRYAELRQVPRINLVYLEWEGSPISTDVETFRTRLLVPVLQAIAQRKLDPSVTTIAWSADFPYVIDFSADLKPASKIDMTARRFPQGSLTGLTYLSLLVMAKDVRYTQLGTNLYYRPSVEGSLLLPTCTIAPGTNWNNKGEPDAQGMRYVPSIMLGYTSGRGNSLAEVEEYLRRSLLADGTYPAGKIYFMTNGDVRAKTRAPAFSGAVQRLEELGVAAEVVEGVLPRERGDVMGAMIGTVDYRFADSHSYVLPGAICENLTSLGGILRENGGQTPLTECLRAGAAGSSGTVTEPFAIQAKFPHPMLHVHYAEGCSLIEAFYQSLQGPYQLLIVGDPLCRPWATIPAVRVEGLPERGVVTGRLSLVPSAAIAEGKKIARYELYCNGQLMTQCRAGETLEVDTKILADGEHELRVVAYEDSPIATQGTWIKQITTSNHGWKPIAVSIGPAAQVAWEDNVTIDVDAPGCQRVGVYYNHHMVAMTTSPRVSITLPASELGPGPGEVQVVASAGSGAERSFTAIEKLTVAMPKLLPALEAPPATRPGLKLTRDGKAPVIVEALDGDWAAQAEVAAGEHFTLESIFTADRQDLYQLQLEFDGSLTVEVDGQEMLDATHTAAQWRYAPMTLAPGAHRLVIRGMLGDNRILRGAFGRQGTQALRGDLFHHVE